MFRCFIPSINDKKLGMVDLTVLPTLSMLWIISGMNVPKSTVARLEKHFALRQFSHGASWSSALQRFPLPSRSKCSVSKIPPQKKKNHDFVQLVPKYGGLPNFTHFVRWETPSSAHFPSIFRRHPASDGRPCRATGLPGR